MCRVEGPRSECAFGIVRGVIRPAPTVDVGVHETGDDPTLDPLEIASREVRFDGPTAVGDPFAAEGDHGPLDHSGGGDHAVGEQAVHGVRLGHGCRRLRRHCVSRCEQAPRK